MAALYQQARPITFDQVIGQEHVKDLLVASLQKGRIGHAYLFSGPRGVGKTTTARLLAMAVNCSNPTTKPCGECESCLLVRQASHPDVIELDAASNNSVEDIRDLREKVNLSSIRGGSRVWILDEAHMLTKSAANALLKTLEEPPSNLVFVLATTEPEKLPPTILSRCQHYRFRRLSETEIAGKLQSLCDAAKVEAEADAIALIARAADGAMRDGESLLERLLSQEKKITRKDAEEALGLPPQERIEELASHLMTGKLDELFSGASALYRDGFAPRTLVERLKMSLRDAVYTKLKIEGYIFELKNPEKDILKVIHALDEENERFARYNDLFSLEVSLIKAHNSLSDNEPGNGAIIISQGQPAGPQNATVRPQTNANNSKSSLPDFDPNTSSAGTARATPQPQAQPSAKPPSQSSSGKPANWNDVKKRASAQLKAFLLPGKAVIEGSVITINYNESRHKFHFDQLKSRKDELRTLVDDVLGKGYTIQLNGEGGNLTLKPDAADQAAVVTPHVSPQPIQELLQPVQNAIAESNEHSEDAIEDTSTDNPTESDKFSKTTENISKTTVENKTENTALITKVEIETDKSESNPDSKEAQTPKRSIKAPDTIPDDSFFDAKKIRESKKKDLEAIPKNDSIQADDLDAVLPDTETENERLSGNFWGEDVGSVAAPTPVATSEVKSADITKTVDAKAIEVNEVNIPLSDSVSSDTKVEPTKIIESELKAQKDESESNPEVISRPQTPDKTSKVIATEEEEEIDDSEVAVKARLEQLQILFPGEMSLMETFDKSDDLDDNISDDLADGLDLEADDD